MSDAWLRPEWPAPPHVRAFVTTRAGGVSEGEYASMNLGFSSGDDPARVRENRAIVRAALPSEPAYLRQTHGVDTADLDAGAGDATGADAAFTATRERVACVLTADCLPLFLADRDGTRVAAVHAGWRGMAAGVIEGAVRALALPPASLVAWMGPAIGPDAFEVGPEVREAFVARHAEAAGAFRPHAPGKYLADLYALARLRLAACGVGSVHGGGFCTYRERERFFSYRRVRASGRMGAFIWME